MSALEYLYLSPLTYTKIYLNSHTWRRRSPLRQNACRFVPNSAVVRVPGGVWRDTSGRVDLWRLRRVQGGSGATRASSGQEGDSGEKSGEGQGVTDKGSTRSGSNRRREKQDKGWWFGSKSGKWRWQPIVQAQEVGVLLLQLGIVVFVMRLLRPGIPLPGSEPRAATSFVSVPYSEFLSKINGDQVQKVEVDGVHIMFKLKSDVEASEVASSAATPSESESLVKSVAPTKKIVYTTTRPSDIRTPYGKMMENEVEFGSPDKRSGGFFNSALVSIWNVVSTFHTLNASRCIL